MKKNKHFSKFIKFVLYLLLFIILNSCARSGNPLRSDWLLTESQRDSAVFSKYHHYNIGTNFISTSDSLPLYSHLPGIVVLTNVSDTTIYLKEGMDFIVTEIFKPLDFKERGIDSVWLRVASDNMHLGWVEENVMLEKSTPTSPISQLITKFSGRHIYWFYFIVAVSGLISAFRKYRRKKMWFLHFKDIYSIYPTAFMACVATSASVYALIQMYAPDLWVEYYFNPSLNPVGKPFIIALFLCLVWLCILLLITVIFELYEKVSFEDAASYFVSLVAWAGAVYIVLTFTIPIYVGFLFYIIYIYYIVYKYKSIKKHI